jgi:O-acetyl-ADP-ribose deacetylase (regulator of RNase III)
MVQRRVYRIGASQLTLEFGDLTGSRAQVLVSSDDYYLTMSGGVSEAIRSAGGSAITLDAAKRVPARLCDVVVTTAGTLPAWYVFHAVTIGPGGAEIGPEEVIRRTTRRCLSLLDAVGASSVAFPAIGAGTAHFALDHVAAEMADAIADDLLARPDPIDVTIYLFTQAGMTAFDFVRFFEEFARRTPAIAAHELRAPREAQGLPVLDGGTRAASPRAAGAREDYVAVEQELLDLERQRQQLEERIVALRRQRAPEEQVAEVEAELTRNRERRLGRIAEQQRIREKGVEVFISYAHEDEAWCDALRKHLSSLRQEGVITDWYDRKIGAGADWDQDIAAHMESARVILLLLSPDFMYSDYIAEAEIPRALELHRAGKARVIPVAIRAVDWQQGPLGKLNALPKDGRPVDSWSNRDEALYEVAQGIRRELEQLFE